MTGISSQRNNQKKLYSGILRTDMSVSIFSPGDGCIHKKSAYIGMRKSAPMRLKSKKVKATIPLKGISNISYKRSMD